MALTFQEVKSLIDGNIGSVKTVTLSSDQTKRGASGSSSSGLFIKRTGEVTGSVSGSSLTITLEGGNIGWDGALTQDNDAAYFTIAQRSMLSTLTKYISSMSNATIDNEGIN